jgi:hypothetical protein
VRLVSEQFAEHYLNILAVEKRKVENAMPSFPPIFYEFLELVSVQFEGMS